MARKGRRQRERPEVNGVLDLVPVMSLVVHLIPMLLLSLRFDQFSELLSGGPVIPSVEAPGEEALAEQQQKVVSVRITAEGFVVGGLAAGDPRIPCRGACTLDTYDYQALNEAMVAAKREHPSETEVVLAPDADIPFEVLVGAMDATRAVKVDGVEQGLFPVPLIASVPR